MAGSESERGIAAVCHIESKGTTPIKSLVDAIPAGSHIIIPSTTTNGREIDVKVHDPQRQIPVNSPNVLWKMPAKISPGA